MFSLKSTLVHLGFVIVLTQALLVLLSNGQQFENDDQHLKEQLRRKVKSGFSTSRAQVSLTCGPDAISVQLNFTRPFKGFVHAGPKNSDCQISGDGRRYYRLSVPLDGCGTQPVEPSGSFSNTLTIRFHPSLELEGDEIKTIICRFGTGSLNVG